MIKTAISSYTSILLRSSPLRNISFSQRIYSDEIWNKNVQLQLQQLTKKEKDALEYKKTIDEKTQRWKDQYEIYYGKERDLVNYPLVKQQLFHPKVRLGYIPAQWFHELYDKTGVTGPYLLFFGGVAFSLQKEFWVIDHDIVMVPAMIACLLFVHKKFGPKIFNIYKKIVDRKAWFIAIYPKENYTKLANTEIAKATENKAACDVVVDLLGGAKENVGLQLETIYRTRVATVYKNTKSRLDYQVEKEVSKLRYQKQHMIDWIVNSVVKDFTAQQEKATLSQCISDLRALAQKSKTAGV